MPSTSLAGRSILIVEDERLIALGDAMVFRFCLCQGRIENTIEHLALFVSEQRAQRVRALAEMAIEQPDDFG